jgi:hypothetical protein
MLYGSPSKSPQNKYQGGDDHNRNAQESGPDQALLPGFPMLTGRWDRGRSRRTEHRRERREHPIRVPRVEGAPVCSRRRRRQSDLAPYRAQRNQESAVHYTLKVSGDPHAHVREASFEQASNQPEQEQEHAMPHQPSVAGFHGDYPLEILSLTPRLALPGSFLAQGPQGP